ncbi:hypothetical protein CTI12_AA400410 [Artemisia annua]|uniref:Uncharacterized protein n=1 Tax=Artemisia annua TaxID=35608 RepID=A0A2U1MAQ5_ARTAN|nr:hypothetical protein CTI12_AA400410 [Artemisia annua]
MSAMVNIWLRELTKLREKIQLEKTAMKKANHLFFKSISTQQHEEEEEYVAKSASSVVPVTAEKRVSEETIFMLMDRFAPS